MKEAIVSNCERAFLRKALSEGTRLDGRQFDEFRNISISFGTDWGCVQVSLGETKVLAQVSCEVALPKQTRPNEGLLNINVELSPMASPYFETGRMTEECIQINRILEKALKDSRAVDLESLCIVAEDKVWAIRVDVTVLNHEGNIMDCVSIAALLALSHFKRPDVTTTGEQIIIHTIQDKDPLPIVLHHYPVCVTYAIFEENNTIISDPSILEEKVADAQLVFGVNAFRELCGLHLGGSVLTSPELILSCANKAAARAVWVVQLIKDAIEKDTTQRNSMNDVGFDKCIEEKKLTALAYERIPVKLRKWNPNLDLTNNKRPGNGFNKHFRFNDNDDDKMDEEVAHNTLIKSVGAGSAEVTSKTIKFGEGLMNLKNSWFPEKQELSDLDSSCDEEEQNLSAKHESKDNSCIEKNIKSDTADAESARAGEATIKFGEGSENTWIKGKKERIVPDSSDGEEEPKPVVKPNGKKGLETTCNVIVIDSESSEEEVVLLEEEIVKIDLTVSSNDN